MAEWIRMDQKPPDVVSTCFHSNMAAIRIASDDRAASPRVDAVVRLRLPCSKWIKMDQNGSKWIKMDQNIDFCFEKAIDSIDTVLILFQICSRDFSVRDSWIPNGQLSLVALRRWTPW